MQLREAKQILRAALETATDEKLAEMLAAAETRQMPYVGIFQCFATRLYGLKSLETGARDAYFSAAQAYVELGSSGKDRQVEVAPLISNEIISRAACKRALIYFSAAEDQSWFLLSLSRRKSIKAAFVTEEQAAYEYVGARR